MNAAACFSKLTGNSAEFSQGVGLVFDEAARADVLQAREAAEKERALSEQRAADAEAQAKVLAATAAAERKTLKCDLLAQKAATEDAIADLELLQAARRAEARLRTFEECAAWYDDDAREAITNTVCRDAFAEFGLPDTNLKDTASAGLVELKERSAAIEGALQQIAAEEEFVRRASELEFQKFKANEALRVEAERTSAEGEGC